MLKRIIGVLTFRPAVYREIAADVAATREAVFIVFLSLFVQGVTAGLIEADGRTRIVRSNLARGLGETVAAIISGLVAWIIAAWVLALVAKLLKGHTNTSEMLRVTGYVEVFGIIIILSVLAPAFPALAFLAEAAVFIIAILGLFGYLLGVSEAADLSIHRAFVAALAAGIINALVVLLITDLVIRPLGIAGA